MRKFVYLLTLAATALTWAAHDLRAAKPNILFLFADDFTYEAVRYLGHTDIDTPNLDRLARRGTSFEKCYNMGSWSPAVCIASRAMLMTGRQLWDTAGVHPKMGTQLDANLLWPQLLSKAGYKTYMTGKWHIPVEASRCFDSVGTVRQGMPKDTPSSYGRPLEGKQDSWRADDSGLGGYWAGGKHWSEVTANEAIEFIGATGNAATPYFMYVAFNAPHDPRQSPREYLERYPLERIALPKSFLPLYPHKDKIGCGQGLRDEKLAPFPRTEDAVKVHRREYYALISHLDTQIGRILDALDASGQASNTWIFFTADHGLAVGNHGLMGKQNLYEHSVRVPFIVAGPGVPSNEMRKSPIYLQDAMATTLSIAGAQKPAHVFFKDIQPQIQGNATPSGHGAIYGAYLNLQRSILSDGWKLIHYPNAGVSRLYNLQQDPLEMTDLVSDKNHTKKRSELSEMLARLQRELGDSLVSEKP